MAWRVDPATGPERLEALTVDRLKPIARLVASSPPTRKADLVALIWGKLTDPRFLRSYWDHHLDEIERNAVREAVYHDGQLDTRVLQAKYGRTVRTRSSGYSYSERETTPPLAPFFLLSMSIPAEVVALLREFVPEPEPFVLSGVKEAPETFQPKRGEPVPLQRADTEQAAIHDLLAVLELAREGKVAVGEKTGAPSAATLRALGSRLLLPEYSLELEERKPEDSIRAFGLVVEAPAGGLARVSGGRLRLTRAGEVFLREPSAARLRDAFGRWLTADAPDELRRIRSVKGQQGRRTDLTPPSERKAAIADALRRCPIGEWIAIPDFLRAIVAWHLLFTVEDGEYSGLYVGWSAEYGTLDADAYLALVQGQYALVVLWEHMAGFGALDVLYVSPEDAEYPVDAPYFDESYFSRYDGLKHFRINALGAYLLERTDAYDGPAVSERPPAFTVLANLDVAVTDPRQFAPNDRAFLERVAAPHGEGVYRLDRERILAAAEDGIAVDTVEEFLSTRGARAVPDPVSRFLADLRANTQAFQPPVRALLIRCRDEYVRDLLVHDTVLGKLCAPTGAESLTVAERDEAAFRRRLRKLGYAVPPR
ncbi:MAG: hypothetical protein HY321_20985 [Armatimonadetes bacterium]|nr:hypothetical protein [Armatimonadota bacterium]